MIKNDLFLYKEAVDNLSTILAISYFYKFNFKALEKRISKSEYFNSLKTTNNEEVLYIEQKKLIDQIFPEIKIQKPFVKEYIETDWVGEMYIYLLENTNLNLESIFLYIPIEKAIEMFPVYHEMDFSQCLTRLMELRSKETILNILLKRNKKSTKTLSKETNISESMINSLRIRRRKIENLNAIGIFKISSYLKVSIETLLNN